MKIINWLFLVSMESLCEIKRERDPLGFPAYREKRENVFVNFL